MIYLIQYNRDSGELVQFETFPSKSKHSAEEERLRVELQLLSRHVSHEVVLLEAKNEEELRKTHRRYFEGLDQMLAESTAAH